MGNQHIFAVNLAPKGYGWLTVRTQLGHVNKVRINYYCYPLYRFFIVGKVSLFVIKFAFETMRVWILTAGGVVSSHSATYVRKR
jgi:hypothetical protein